MAVQVELYTKLITNPDLSLRIPLSLKHGLKQRKAQKRIEE